MKFLLDNPNEFRSGEQNAVDFRNNFELFKLFATQI